MFEDVEELLSDYHFFLAFSCYFSDGKSYLFQRVGSFEQLNLNRFDQFIKKESA